MNPKTYWNYRIVITREPDIVNRNEWVYHATIRDVYYENDKPKSWGADPQFPSGETIADLKADMENMMVALTKPPLIVDENDIREVKEGERISNEDDEYLFHVLGKEVPTMPDVGATIDVGKYWTTSPSGLNFVQQKWAELNESIRLREAEQRVLRERQMMEQMYRQKISPYKIDPPQAF